MPIHPTAVIDPNTRMGKNVSVGPFAVIGPDVEIGDNCQIWPHAVIEHSSLGTACQVFPQASLGLAPQHLKYKGEKTRLIVGNRTVFREGVTVHRGTMLDKGTTAIGNDCYFMALSHVAHDCRIGNSVILANGAQVAGHVTIDDSCFLSAMVGVHQFVRIGKGALLSGGAMVALDVAPYCIAQGDRADIRGLNVVGMRRLGMDRTSMKLIKEAFKTVFYLGLSLTEALRQPALLLDNPYVKTFREFFLEPKRGFLRPAGESDQEALQEELVS